MADPTVPQSAPSRVQHQYGPMDCLSAPTSAPNLRPSAALCPKRVPMQYHRLHPSLHKVPPCTALFCPACTFVEPIMSQSGTRCSPGAPLVQISIQVGKGPSPAHHAPNACPGCPHHRTQRLSRVFAWALGGRLVHVYRAWASVGKQAVLKVIEISRVYRCSRSPGDRPPQILPPQ